MDARPPRASTALMVPRSLVLVRLKQLKITYPVFQAILASEGCTKRLRCPLTILEQSPPLGMTHEILNSPTSTTSQLHMRLLRIGSSPQHARDQHMTTNCPKPQVL